MPLVLKLVGDFPHDKKKYELRDSFEGYINLQLLINLFTTFGVTSDEINEIKFITNSERMNHPEKSYLVTPNEDRDIFIFTANINLKQKLLDIFIKQGAVIQQNSQSYQSSDQNTEQPSVSKSYQYNQPVYPDPEICKPITMKESEPIPKLTNELIDTMNVKSVSLFADQDFKSLISVYLRRPELFGIMAQYVQHGNVVEESLSHLKNIDDLTDEELAHYQSLADKINHLEIGVTNDVIINKLIKFSGHLNLTLRSILCDMAKNPQDNIIGNNVE